jgi:predicted Kef-type K+ transport protein/Trk K+ transport system NAD-binding subunit
VVSKPQINLICFKTESTYLRKSRLHGKKMSSMDPGIWIIVAFILGFAARQVGLPPLVGFLAAGFVLNAMGAREGALIVELSDLGVTLLLFSIGLKLRLRSLIRPEVWAGALSHMLITIIVFGLGIFALAKAGLSLFSGLDFRLSLMLAFALSFSSTVFAVKVLEEKAEMSSLHGRVAIGILIMQDILAVIFLTASADQLPSPWALLVPVALLAIRPLLMKIMDRCGHGELLILFGLFVSLVVGAAGFKLVGLKPDLGALIMGELIANHPKASELAKSLFSFKEIFLISLFLKIGLSGAPSLEALGIAALFVLVAPFKVVLFFLLLTRFKLRARTSLLGSFNLANYSEFGLIVGAIGTANGWIANEWLVIIAIALSATFVLASPLNTAAHRIYARLADRLKPFETKGRHPDDQPIDPGNAEIAIYGMGRIGNGACDYLSERYGDVVIGVDYDPLTVKKHQEAGRNVIYGDPSDPDFWARTRPDKTKIRAALLAMSKHAANLAAAKQIVQKKFPAMLAATAHFEDEISALKKAGVHAAFNFYAEAGTGLAERAFEIMESQTTEQIEEKKNEKEQNDQTHNGIIVFHFADRQPGCPRPGGFRHRIIYRPNHLRAHLFSYLQRPQGAPV